jgi:hypothetical protein
MCSIWRDIFFVERAKQMLTTFSLAVVVKRLVHPRLAVLQLL